MEYNKGSTYYNKKTEIKGIGTVDYETVASFKKRYPPGQRGYEVIGAIGKGIQKELGTWTIEGVELPYYENKYAKMRYGIKGYIEVDKDTYIVIVKEDYTKLFQIVTALILIALLVVGGPYVFQEKEGPLMDPGSKKYHANVPLPEDMDKTKILIPGYEDIQMDAGKKEAYVALWNPDDNPCYFKFQFMLDEGGEIIYSSGLVSPGNAITTVNFDRKFEKGIYPITIRIESFSLSDYTKPLNGGEVKARIVALADE